MFRKLSSYGSVPRTKSSENEEQQPPVRRVPEIVVDPTEDEADERQPLLNRDASHSPQDSSSFIPTTSHKDLKERDIEHQKPFRRKRNQFGQIVDTARFKGSSFLSTITNPKTWTARSIWQHGVKEPVSLVPCVFLGLLLNVLDALSYGMCSGSSRRE